MKQQVEERDGAGCFLCLADEISAFRLNPNGGNDLANLVALCDGCRDHLNAGNTHRDGSMPLPRWLELVQRQRRQGFTRPTKRSDFNIWTWKAQLAEAA